MPTTQPAATGSGNVAADSLWDTAGDVAVGTGANTAGKRNILSINDHGNCGASEAFDLSAAGYAQHSATVDQAATELQIKDPGIGNKSWLYLTASADSALTWKNEAGAAALVKDTNLFWINDADLVSVTNGRKYIIQLIRLALDTYWIGYLPVGWTE